MIKESYISKIFKIGTAGFIKDDGTFLYADENEESYHGGFDEETVNAGYPEFSNTHPEEDTCVRLYKEPNEIQYKKLEEVIDTYLDFEQYCKIEIWNNGKYNFYKVYSLIEGACEDNSWEEQIGNWTGYKLVQIIKNYFNNINENKKIGIFSIINESSRSTLISKSKSADKYANGKGSRWTQKSKCSVASTVKDYNKIDMNTFWKEDILTFGVKVVGETNEYVVTISFKDILPKIQRKINDNKELLEFKCIYDALIQAINSGDVKISCTCPDYKYRLKYWNSQNGDEAGEKETRASDVTNPENTKGPACKHILAVLNNVDWLNKIASVINNYANYCKDNMQYNYSKFIFPKLYGMPYNKAVQMSLEDYDENGEIKDTLGSEEALINLSNALGKDRGKFKKGSNKNPATKKKEESLQESIDLNENFDKYRNLINHFDRHVLGMDLPSKYKKFSDLNIHFNNPQEYKKSAEDLAATPLGSGIEGCSRIYYLNINGTKKPVVQYCKAKRIGKDYLIVIYIKGSHEERIDPNSEWHRHVITYFVSPTNSGIAYDMEYMPDEEASLTNWNASIDKEKTIKQEENILKDVK